MLGDDYAAICNKSIVSQIEERMAADANASFFGYGDSADETDSLGKFETVDANTSFYLNAEGKVVISFPEYSIAPGYMGIQEFTITK
ncbi:RsiV family protein [Anaerotignum faecicola]